MDQLTLGTEKIDVKPMTWGVQKQVFKLLTNGLSELDSAQATARLFIKSVSGQQDASLKPLMDLLGDAPELVTKILATGLGVDEKVLNDASGLEVMTALEVFIQENALDEQLERAKKAFSLLRPQAKAAGSAGRSEAGS